MMMNQVSFRSAQKLDSHSDDRKDCNVQGFLCPEMLVTHSDPGGTCAVRINVGKLKRQLQLQTSSCEACPVGVVNIGRVSLSARRQLLLRIRMTKTSCEIEILNSVTCDVTSPSGLIMEDGSINWNCPCLGGMAAGPCGPAFREAFSCFHFSDAEPKGSDCLEQFQAMQNCMSEYPELYESDKDSENGEDVFSQEEKEKLENNTAAEQKGMERIENDDVMKSSSDVTKSS